MVATRSNTTLVVVAAFLGGCLTTQLAHTPAAHAAQTTKFNGPGWDYKKVAILGEDEAKELGAQGWELCACSGGACYFKRPL